MGRECNKIKKTMKKVDNSMVDINMEKRRRVFKEEESKGGINCWGKYKSGMK